MCVCVCVCVCACARGCVRGCVRARVHARAFSQISTIALYNHMYIYTHIHICVVVFCPDSNQEHVDHTRGEKNKK